MGTQLMDSCTIKDLKDRLKTFEKSQPENINKDLKDSINKLARMMFFMRFGRALDEGYDFSNAPHPEEKFIWLAALLSWDFWMINWKE